MSATQSDRETPRSSAWIFQCTQDRFDLSKPDSLKPGTTVDWRVTRYREEMKPNQRVYFWMAGGEYTRGIYGYGHLLSEPYMDQEKDSWRTSIQVSAKLYTPVLASTLKDDPLFADSLIIRQPEGSNFRLGPDEVTAIERTILKINPRGEIDVGTSFDDLSEQVRGIIEGADLFRLDRGSQLIHTVDLLRSLAEQPNGQLRRLLQEANVSLDSIIGDADYGSSAQR